MKLTTIRYVLSIVAAEDLHMKQLDIIIAFFHGELEGIYMLQSQEYITPGKEHLVCKLKKSL